MTHKLFKFVSVKTSTKALWLQKRSKPDSADPLTLFLWWATEISAAWQHQFRSLVVDFRVHNVTGVWRHLFEWRHGWMTSLWMTSWWLTSLFQADVCHAYQIVSAHGVPDDHIIVMMYDDIAKNPENPTKGDVYLQKLHCKDKIPKFRNKYSQKRNIGVSVPISTFMHLWIFFYIFPRSVCLFCWRKYVDRSWDYIRLTDTWMWKLGLRPRYSQKRNK
jgi:hypothetical protein